MISWFQSDKDTSQSCAGVQPDRVGERDFRGGVQIQPQSFNRTLDELAHCLARPEFSEKMLGCLRDRGRPNPDKAVRNHAMRGIGQTRGFDVTGS
jgi:hypothetical protein